jgi:peptidoglycan/xylan/chitin deacetylase (PgdA/CDA1 family)
MIKARMGSAQQGEMQVTPAEAYPVNVHGGPGLDYETIALLNPGEAAPVLSQIDTGDPVTSWWEIACCQGVTGWVRADVVNVIGSSAAVTQARHPGRSPNAGEGVRPENRPLENAVGQPILYFTFDDGPYSPETEMVLDVLEKNDAEATFFVIGQQVVWDPELTQQETLREHSVQNHTYSHAALDTLERGAFYQEVEQTQIAVQQATGILPTCLRPPYGATDGTTIQQAEELGLDIVLWTIDTQDWTRPGTEALVEYILDNVYPGAILLMHDGGGERSQTIAALDQVLPQLAAQGYVFERLCR